MSVNQSGPLGPLPTTRETLKNGIEIKTRSNSSECESTAESELDSPVAAEPDPLPAREDAKGATQLGLTFAPVSRPLHRRKQTALVLWHTSSILFFITFYFFLLAIPFFWLIIIPYTIYAYFDKTPMNGNVTKRYSTWFRKLGIWRHFCNYFPIKLFRTTSLVPTFTETEVTGEYYNIPILKYLVNIKKPSYKKEVKTGPVYLFGLHPHGVASFSGFGAFGSEGAYWSKNFPGIKISILTLINQFYIPIYREYLLAMGISSAAKRNALQIMKNGWSIAIVIGGAQESLLARPDTNNIILKKRKGFVKLALETGNVGLVPCYCFGENDLYKIVELSSNSFWRRFQFWLKSNFGFTIPLFHARGIFNYDFGLLPYRKQVTVVTGNPIMVPYLPSPKPEEVDKYHKLYIDELKRIFYDYRSKFIENGDQVELNIVE